MRETIVGVATPPGSGALAVVRLSGGAADTVRKFLSPSELEPRRATRCAVAHGGETIDDSVAVFFPAASSPTGEDLVEISCHGSPYIVERLVKAALACGARQAEPGEFTQRAFLNGKLDLAQAEAVCDLIMARAKDAHEAALRQLSGGLSREIAKLREPVLELLVRIEANLDHPEEDIPSMPAEEFERSCARASRGVETLAATFERGRLMREGARIAIVGRPNAGKSSLLNALIGRDRAIVCPEPGTTRDTLEESADLKGMQAVLIDTAGIREEAVDGAEKSGIARTEKALRNADAAVLVIDGGREPSVDDRRVHERILKDAADKVGRCVTVVSKADLAVSGFDFPVGSLRVSSVSGEGLNELSSQLSDILRQKGGRSSSLITSTRHHQALMKALAELQSAAGTPTTFPLRWEDRAASSLRAALRSLDEITGAAAGDEVLAEIFSRFCVGK